MAHHQYEEEAPPPPAFQMDAQPQDAMILPDSMRSVEAEVLQQPKAQGKAFGVYNQNNMMNMNGGGMGMMPQNMMAMNPNMRGNPQMNRNMMVNPNMKGMNPHMKGGMNPQMNPNRKPPPIPPNAMGGKNAANNAAGGMPFPILSEAFMNNMLNMAANLDVQDMNMNMKQQIASNQRKSNPKNKVNPPKPKYPKGAHISKMASSPNVGYNQNYAPQNMPPRQKSHHEIGKNKAGGVKAMAAAFNSYAAKPPQGVPAAAKPQQPPPPPRPLQVAQAHNPPQPDLIPQVPPPQPQQAQAQQQPLHAQEFDNPIQGELVSMGFEKEYVIRACNLYKKKFKNKPLRLEVLTEIIIRLQQRDQSRRQRSKSIDSLAGAGVAIAAADPGINDMNNANANRGNNARRRSSAQGNMHPNNMYNNNAVLQQSESYEYIQNNNDYHNNYAMGIHRDQNMKQMEKQKSQSSNPESIAISIVMSASSIGPQNCDIIIRKDQTLQDAKQLISTCLTDFDQYDQSYAFFDDHSGYIFDEMDMAILQLLQLMDIKVDQENIVLTLKIGRILSKYIKLK